LLCLFCYIFLLCPFLCKKQKGYTKKDIAKRHSKKV
jgi:hypothetical protein